VTSPDYWYNPNFFPHPPPRRSYRGVRNVVVCFVVVALAAGAIFYAMNRYTSRHSSTAGTAQLVAAPSAKAVVTKNGVYRSATAHFAVRFPSTPTSYSRSELVSGMSITLQVFSASHTLIEEAEFGRDMTASDRSDALAGTVHGMRSGAYSTIVTKVRAIRFHRQQARRVTLRAGNGERFTAVVVLYPPRRIYVLMAPTGKQFNALAKSFRVLG